MAYCERKGNERLVKLLGCMSLDSHTACSLRADKYNKKIQRYRVEVEDADSSEEEDIEREVKQSVKACAAYFRCFLLGWQSYGQVQPPRPKEDTSWARREGG